MPATANVRDRAHVVRRMRSEQIVAIVTRELQRSAENALRVIERTELDLRDAELVHRLAQCGTIAASLDAWQRRREPLTCLTRVAGAELGVRSQRRQLGMIAQRLILGTEEEERVSPRARRRMPAGALHERIERGGELHPGIVSTRARSP